MLIMKDGKVGPARVKVSSSPSYTLKEIEELAKQWRDENDIKSDGQWVVTHLLAWLARREREGRSSAS